MRQHPDHPAFHLGVGSGPQPAPPVGAEADGTRDGLHAAGRDRAASGTLEGGDGQAVPGSASQTDWAGFFQLLDGHPGAVVADQASAILNAVKVVWPVTATEPAPQPVWCVHHVKETFLFPVWVQRPSTPTETTDARRFKAAFSACARSPQHWDAFVQLAGQLDPGPSLETWVSWNGRVRGTAPPWLAVAPWHRGHDLRLASADGEHELDPSLPPPASHRQRVRPGEYPPRGRRVAPSAAGHQPWCRPPSGVQTPR